MKFAVAREKGLTLEFIKDRHDGLIEYSLASKEARTWPEREAALFFMKLQKLDNRHRVVGV